MLYFTRSDIAPNGISIDPFRELIAPLLAWGVAVFSIKAAGQPGVVCVTPMAWLRALWCGAQYVYGARHLAALRERQMTEIFSKTFHVGWGDLDSNGHMKNTAYLDKAVDVRMMFFQEHGFTVREFERLRLGPVVMRDEIEYFRELRLLEWVRITLTLAGASDDGTRFRLRNDYYCEDGRLAARLTTTGGWLDLMSRKLTSPPAQLIEVMRLLTRNEDFEVLPSSLK